MAYKTRRFSEDDAQSTHSRASSATLEVRDNRDPFDDKFGIEMDDIDAAKKDAKKDEEEAKDTTDPIDRLPESEQAILRAQIDTPTRTHGIASLYRYATRMDLIIICISIITSIISGASMPMMTLIFGGLQKTFQEFLHDGEMTRAKFDSELNKFLLYFLYLAIGTFVASYITTVGFIYTGEHISGQIRANYLKACLRQNIGFFDKLGPGEVTTKITQDSATIQDGISEKVGLCFSALATFIAGYVIGFIKSWQLALILSSCLVALLIITTICTQGIVKFSTPLLESFVRASAIADEVISSVRVAVAFGTQDKLAAKYDEELVISRKWGIKLKVVVGTMVAGFMSLLYMNYGLGFWQGSKFMAEGTLPMSDVTACLMSVMTGTFQMGSVGPYFQAFTRAMTTASAIFNTIDRESPLDVMADSGTKISGLKGHIRLENVKHIYPSRAEVTIMDGVNLDIPAGKVTALVGPSGSGKSTIVGLLERFYNPVQGRLYLDGRDISTLNLRWLRQQIALVGQEPTLFAVTILENIAYGLIGTDYENVDDAKKKELVMDAAKQANAHDFICQLPEGYETNVGQRGFLLSGGQKQRIAIARAIVSNPKILLLDEATSALDTKSEGVVQAALENASEGRTTITIAHRLSTIRDAHNIVVMSGGKVTEQGTHQQLIALRGTYYDLVAAQEIEDENKKNADALMEPLDEEEEMLIRRMSKFKNVGGFYTNPNHADNRRQSYANRKSMAKSAASLFLAEQGEVTVEEPKYGLGTLLKFVASLNKQEWHWMVIGLFASIICGGGSPVQAVFFAKQMVVLAPIIDPRYDPWDIHDDSNFWSLMYLMLGLVQFAAYFVQGLTLAICAEELSRRVRLQTFSSILRQDISYFDEEKNNPGALNAFLAVETAQVAGLSGVTLGTILISVTNLTASLAVSCAIGWELALVCFSVVPVILACGFFRSWMLTRFAQRAQQAYAASAAFAAENIAAMKTVAALTREAAVDAKYSGDIDSQQAASLKSVLKSSTLFAASQSMMYPAYALAFWYGSRKIVDGEYDMFQFYVCFMSVIFGAQSAGTFFSFAPDMAKAKSSAGTLKKLLERKPAIDTVEPTGDSVKKIEGHVEFKNVHFRYPSRPQQPVLRGLNLKIEPGQYVALVGASGCGKSTTIGLMERFYDPLVGELLIDGKDVSKLNVNEYRSLIALVSQEPTLYQGTIRENLTLGCHTEVSEHDIEEACKEANIYDFVCSLPEGLNTKVGAKGGMLSGGQKQRIAIARALIRKPRILLLDEATSALDSESEHIVQAALDRAAKGRTTITIAHRLSTVQHADAIHVFDQGRVVESGTHSELMALEGRYWELVRLQSLNN